MTEEEAYGGPSHAKYLKDRREQQMYQQAQMINYEMQVALERGRIAGTGINVTPPYDTRPRFNPNTDPVCSISLRALMDLWLAKHGDQWVQINASDEFWNNAEARLRNARLLEEYRGWARLMEEHHGDR